MIKPRWAKLNMWVVVAIGFAVCLFSFYRLPVMELGLPFALLALITIEVGSQVNIKIPSFKSNVSISDTFVFLTMLLFGGEAAVLVAVAEALVSSLRISRKPLTIAFNSAAMACSTFATVVFVQMCFGSITALPHGRSFSELIIASCVMGLIQYTINSGIVAIAGALRADQPIWATWKKYLSLDGGQLLLGGARGRSACQAQPSDWSLHISGDHAHHRSRLFHLFDLPQ
ncbi:MAG TPA: hypothetical protein VGV87_21230 [Blastocatellia bacterium]|jgi:hypothetical protein|nr:hypothetical protein [Blastocatellia bacterium]